MSHRLEVRLYRRLPGFTLDVEWTGGEGVAALFGPSGAGKTLTLQCLAGLLRPDAGRIVIDGRVLFDSEAGTDLLPRRSHRPSELSGGQQQRVALGRALAPDPALLLLDEPLSALDLPLRQALRDDLRAVLAEWRTAAVLVTHDFTEAYRLGDRIVVYEDGRVIQAAPRAELLWQPASENVARIVGIRNVLHGTVLKATADRIQFRWREQLLEAVNSPTRSYLPAPESPLAFFIRPEYVRLIRKDRGTPDPGHHMNLMAGRVVGEADFGTTWTLYFKLDAPGGPAQGDYDLEIEVPRLVYEILEISRDRHWQLSIHRGSIHVLPSA